ncbi:MAG: hypothetical protein R3D84_16325 [Paracoccaceae bacterium]
MADETYIVISSPARLIRIAVAMRSVAIDVETANADMASIRSIGVAAFENGAPASEWYSLIDPDDFF